MISRRHAMIGLGLLPLVGCGTTNGDQLRIGWQVPLATQGQIAAILQRTRILQNLGLNPSFSAFSFGTPQMEAARAGAIDVAFVGDQPLLNLISAGAAWKVLCRLFDTRVALFRRAAAGWSGPRGKVFAYPNGSVAHRETEAYQRREGLDPSRDVRNVNIDAAEIAGLLTRPDWGGIDVIAIWEPLASRFEAAAGIEQIFERKTLGVVGVSPTVSGSSELVGKVRQAVEGAWQNFLANEEQANRWYLEFLTTGMSVDTLRNINRLDRNFASHRADIDLTANDRAELAAAAAWAVTQGTNRRPVDLGNLIVGT